MNLAFVTNETTASLVSMQGILARVSAPIVSARQARAAREFPHQGPMRPPAPPNDFRSREADSPRKIFTKFQTLIPCLPSCRYGATDRHKNGLPAGGSRPQ